MRHFRYESRLEPPLARPHFVRRIVAHIGVAAGILAGSLLLGMVGYVHYEALSWTDAFVNAAMLLGGMGPVNALQTEGGKIFAGLYALYAGLVFLIATGLVLAPAFHRLLHKFHWSEE